MFLCSLLHAEFAALRLRLESSELKPRVVVALNILNRSNCVLYCIGRVSNSPDDETHRARDAALPLHDGS